MNVASVGFHCPECLSAGKQVVYNSRVPASATVLQYVVPAFLVACYIVQIVWSKSLSGGAASSDLLVYRDFVAEGEWWRIVTAGFVHGGPLHLALNCYFFYALMRPLEITAGRFGAVALLLLGVVGGSVAVIVEGQAAVGASGAAFAVMSALVLQRLFAGFSLKGSPLISLIGMNLVITFLLPGISIGGHVGGLIAGALGGVILYAAPKANISQTMRTVLTLSSAVFLIGVGVLVANLLVGYTN